MTGQARLVAGLPAKLAEPVSIEVRGEVFMTDADFEVANELPEGEAPVFGDLVRQARWRGRSHAWR